MKVDRNILWSDRTTKTSETVKRCIDKDVEDLSIDDLCGMVTYVDSRKIHNNLKDNPYAQEICKRAGSYEKFMAAKNATEVSSIFDRSAAGFGHYFSVDEFLKATRLKP